MLRYLLLLPCILAGVATLYAQSKTGTIVGQTMTSDPSARDYRAFGVDGVVVEAFTSCDTLYTTTVNGSFFFKKVAAGPVRLRFSHLSYQEVTRDIELQPDQTVQVEVMLQEASQEIGSVTVKGEIPVLTIQGDTLVYHAAAVKTFEGDETIRIVEQLPGVTTSEAGVSVMGKDIARTYVDGRLIFGSSPMAALQNLLANDVVKIRVYDEYVDNNPRHKRRKGDETRRVFNIETKSKLIQATTGHFLASYGADLNAGGRDNRDRYGIGATANFFSESLLLSANAFFNNINRKSNKISDIIAVSSPKSSYDRTTYVNTEFERSWESKWSKYDRTTLRASYTYGDDYTRSENTTEQIYLPSPDYDSRIYADTSRNTRTNRYHAANIYFLSPRYFWLTHDMRFSDNCSEAYQSYASIIDGGTPAGGQTRSLDRLSQYDISDVLHIYGIPHHSLSLRSDISNNDGTGFRTDTLTSTATRRELSSSSYGLSRKIVAEFSGTIHLSREEANNLRYFYTYTWEKSRRKKTSLDLADLGRETIDTTNTYNFTNNYNTHEAGLELRLSLSKIDARLSVKPVFSTTGINRDERFPEADVYDKRFNAFIPSASFVISKMTQNLLISYMPTVQLPSIEQLRPRLDDTNPYMLVAGNRHLKQSYTHFLLGQYSIMFGKRNENLTIVLDARMVEDMIAARRIFFANETALPEWNYTAPAQSTLTTYENVDGMWAVKANVRWVHPLRKLRSRLTVQTSFNYDDTPSFVGDVLNRTRSYAPKLTLDLRANVSRSFRCTVGTRTSYIYSKNSIGQDDKYFMQGVWVTTELANIFKRFYFNTSYSLSYYKRFGVNSYDQNSQILNVSVGCKILKRRGDISFTAYDILNRNSGYKTSMGSDYIQNTWTRSFGRYFTFNIAYKFNSSKSGVTNSGIKDGSVKKY